MFREDMLALPLDTGRGVVIDLADIDFLDSTGLAALLAVLKTLGPQRPIGLCGLRRPVANIFRMTRIDRMVRLFDDQDAAVTALGPGEA